MTESGRRPNGCLELISEPIAYLCFIVFPLPTIYVFWNYYNSCVVGTLSPGACGGVVFILVVTVPVLIFGILVGGILALVQWKLWRQGRNLVILSISSIPIFCVGSLLMDRSYWGTLVLAALPTLAVILLVWRLVSSLRRDEQIKLQS